MYLTLLTPCICDFVLDIKNDIVSLSLYTKIISNIHRTQSLFLEKGRVARPPVALIFLFRHNQFEAAKVALRNDRA